MVKTRFHIELISLMSVKFALGRKNCRIVWFIVLFWAFVWLQWIDLRSRTFKNANIRIASIAFFREVLQCVIMKWVRVSRCPLTRQFLYINNRTTDSEIWHLYVSRHLITYIYFAWFHRKLKELKDYAKFAANSEFTKNGQLATFSIWIIASDQLRMKTFISIHRSITCKYVCNCW